MSAVNGLFVVGLILGAAEEKSGPTTRPVIEARVDARVELMCIIFRLAGNPEYNHRLSKSAYADDVEACFGLFRNHPAVLAAKKLRSDKGVSFDAVMSMAMHIEDAADLKPCIALDKASSLDGRWGGKQAEDFLDKARQFVRQTEFAAFISEHEELYATAARRMTAKVNERDYRGWFDGFFGERAGVEFSIIAGLLNGPSNYGVSIRFPDGREEISPVLGVTDFDRDGMPVFSDLSESLVVHEFCHSYTNPIVDAHLDELEAAGKRLFAPRRKMMQRQAYSQWQTMMRESLVRACEVRYVESVRGRLAGMIEAVEHQKRGFTWTGELAVLLRDQYEANRDRYKTLDAFMPRIVEFFNEYDDKLEAQTARAPKVVSIVPANNANDVDPNLTEIKVTFDRPMKDKAWAVVGGGPRFPELPGKVSYDESRTVFTIPVKLKPDWQYELWLNRNQFTAFQSEAGVPLESVHVTFKTRAE